MKKFRIIVFLFFFVGCYSLKNENKIAKILEKHSCFPLTSAQIRKALKHRQKGLRKLDKNAEIVKFGGQVKISNVKREKLTFGVVVKRGENKELIVKKVFNHSSAYKAGLRKNSRILAINGKPVNDLGDDEVSLFFEKGPSKLYILFTNNGREQDAEIKKDFGMFPAVWGFMISNETAYVRIVKLMPNAARFLEKELATFIKSGAKNALLDLRNVYGGSFGETAKILDLFVPEKKLLFQAKSDKKGYCANFYSENPPKFQNLSIAILTDKKTSLNAEILAQTLKEYMRATVIGEKTAGNVSLTRLFKLTANTALRITVARLVPPSGKDLSDIGISPDIFQKDSLPAERSIFYYPAYLDSDVVLKSVPCAFLQECRK